MFELEQTGLSAGRGRSPSFSGAGIANAVFGFLVLATTPAAFAATPPTGVAERCANDVRPATAAVPSAAMQRQAKQLAVVMRAKAVVAHAALPESGFCWTRAALFVDPTAVPPQGWLGAPATSPGYALLAYLLARRIHHNALSPDEAAGRFVGCALARGGARGDSLSAQVQFIEQQTNIATPEWRAGLGKGVAECGK